MAEGFRGYLGPCFPTVSWVVPSPLKKHDCISAIHTKGYRHDSRVQSLAAFEPSRLEELLELCSPTKARARTKINYHA